MTPYKGIIRIVCDWTRCPRKLRDNVLPECMDCEGGRIEVLDLDGGILFQGPSGPEKSSQQSAIGNQEINQAVEIDEIDQMEERHGL